MGFVTVGAGGLLGVQFYQMYKGQTFHELQKNDHIYSRAFMRNVVDIFGKNWLIALFVPFFPSSRPGDGSHYPPRDQVGQGGVADVGTTSASNQSGGRKMVKST